MEKRYKSDPNPSLSYDDTVQLALACMQNVLGSDLKAGDVEVICALVFGLSGAFGSSFLSALARVLISCLFWHECAQACVVRSDALKFTRLTDDQVEAHLTALAERDDDVAARD